MDVEFIKKLNEKNQKATRKALTKIIAKNEKKNFHTILTMQQLKKVEKHYDVFLIASKIAHGESVSSDELKYIREHAPGLLADARKQFKEMVEKQAKGAENQEKPVEKIEGSEENKTEKYSEILANNDSDLEDINNFI
jgi:vacuolar-type H+-ATPase subunit H